MDVPVVLINSCSKYAAENLVKGILDTDNLPSGNVLIENLTSYPWNIDTKYYTADIEICITKDRTIGDKNFATCVEAFVVFFNPEEEDTFQQVKSWSSFLEQLDPEIKLLVCDRCTENTNVTRLVAQTWCIDNGFELVELNPEELSDSETEDDFAETTGIKRIIQSLHAHPWPNLILKDTRSAVSPYIRQLMKEEHDAKQNNIVNSDDQEISDTAVINSSNALNSTDSNCLNGSEKSDSVNNINSETGCAMGSSKETGNSEVDSEKSDSSKDKKGNSANDTKVKQTTRGEKIDNLFPSDQMLFEALGEEDPGGQSFEQLFEKFASMKDKSKALPVEERKKYAETVAVAFWRAMGGDDDEIGNLDDL